MTQRRPRDRPPALRWLASALLPAAAAVLAGCSSGTAASGPANTPVASLPGHTAPAASGGAALTQAQSDRDMLAFTHCMRAHGVAVRDPFHRPGHAGLTLDVPSAPPPAATRACNHFIAPLVQAKQAAAAANMTPARLAALTRYAQCMRSHDIAMLDPDRYGGVALGPNSQFGRYSPQFRSADTACRHLLPAGVRDDGTGP